MIYTLFVKILKSIYFQAFLRFKLDNNKTNKNYFMHYVIIGFLSISMFTDTFISVAQLKVDK